MNELIVNSYVCSLTDHMDKFWLKDEPELMQLLEEINYYLGPFPDVRPLPDGSLPTVRLINLRQ